jgi:hypothetical protein
MGGKLARRPSIALYVSDHSLGAGWPCSFHLLPARSFPLHLIVAVSLPDLVIRTVFAVRCGIHFNAQPVTLCGLDDIVCWRNIYSEIARDQLCVIGEEQ